MCTYIFLLFKINDNWPILKDRILFFQLHFIQTISVSVFFFSIKTSNNLYTILPFKFADKVYLRRKPANKINSISNIINFNKRLELTSKIFAS